MVRDKSLSSRLLDVFIHTSLIILSLSILYPILNTAATSFSSSLAVEQNIITIFPKDFTLEAYKIILKNHTLPRSFLNSVLYTVGSTVFGLLFTTLYAYPLSKKHLTFRRFYMTLLLITMYFSGGLIPAFLLIRNLKLYDTIWAIIIPGNVPAYHVIYMFTFFRNIPQELEESAYLDGASDFAVLFKIILPLSTASVATIALFVAVIRWNDWYQAVIYLKDMHKYPLALMLREMLIQDNMATVLQRNPYDVAQGGIDDTTRVSLESLRYAVLFISIVPMMIVYPFVQKYFIKGIMLGSLKG